MELKTPPECESGNGLMKLRTAGNHSTRPGQQYYICPVGLKHGKRFFWFDEYHASIDNFTEGRSYKTDSNSSNIGDQSLDSGIRMRFNEHTRTNSASQIGSPSNQPETYATHGLHHTDCGISSTTMIPSMGLKTFP